MKLLIKLLAGLFALLILAAVTLLIVIDPNDYKEEIQAQVKKSINRELLIKGDLGWTFFPQLGFSSGEIVLNNLDGFNREHLAKIDNAAVGLAVLPLFKGEIQIAEVTVNGLLLNLITNKDGTSNLDNMFPEKTDLALEQTDQQADAEKSGVFDASKLQLAGLTIKNAQIEVQDLQAGSTTKVNIDHILLGKFVPGEATDLAVATKLLVAEMDGHLDLQTKLIIAPDFSTVQLNDLKLESEFSGADLPNGKLSSSIRSDIAYDLASSTAKLSDFIVQLDEINLTGDLSVQATDKTKVRFALQGNTWDLSPYMAKPSEKAAEKTDGSAQQTAPPAEQEPDLSFLHDLDVKGTLAIAGIKADDLKIGEIKTNITISQGKAQIKPLSAQLYEGLLTLNAQLADAKGSNSYQIDSQLKDIKIYPLLVDAAGIDLLSGTTAFNFSASGKGLTASKIKSGLVGEGDFTLLDGELYGINIPQELRALKAKLSGQPAPTEEDIKKTDFASLTGQFNISKGIVNNNKLLMLSPVMRLDGAGLADILQESLNYKLSVTPLSKSDAETELQDLRGLTIPLLITGPFTQPKFALDTEGALKEQLKAKADAELQKQKQKLQEKKQQLEEKSQEKIKEKSKELEEKLKNKLGDLFG